MRRLLTILSALIAHLIAFGQSTSGEVANHLDGPQASYDPKVFPPSPEAFSFTKFGNLPIGLVTGTAQLSIPVYTIKSGSLSHTISLSYASNGVKVDEVSSRVGTGWNLQAGGVITRMIHDKPDEANLSTRIFYHGNYFVDTNNFYNYVIHAADVGYDFQPDEFTFSSNGLSGKFIHMPDGSFQQFTKSKIDISGDENLGSFTITNTNGDVYYFGLAELTKSYTEGESYPIGTEPELRRTAWYLTGIVSAKGDTINFHYSTLRLTGNVSYPTGVSQSYQTSVEALHEYIYMDNQGGFMTDAACTSPAPTGVSTKVQMNEFNGFYLTSITFPNGKIELKYSDRDDVLYEKKLDSIKVIRTTDNQLIRCFALRQFYANASSSYDAGAIQTSHSELRKRLFMDRFYEVSNDLAKSNYYEFSYDSADYLPPRLSFAQDEFGFYNGQLNSYFFPNDTWLDPYLGGNHYGGNRNFYFQFARKGMLKKVTYPTGGSSEFEFEPHTLKYTKRRNVSYDSTYVAISGTTVNNQYNQSSIFHTNGDKMYQIKVHSEWEGEPAAFFPEGYYIMVSIIDSATNSCVYYCDRHVNPGDSLVDGSLVWRLGSSTYRIKITASQPGVMGAAYVIGENVSFDSIANQPVGGMRVKSIADYDQWNNQFNRREFIYGDWTDSTSSSGMGLYSDGMKLSYVTAQRTLGLAVWDNGSLLSSNPENKRIYSGYNYINSSSLYNVYRGENNTVMYEKVIELNSKTSSLNNGGTEHEYHYETKTEPRALTTAQANYVFNFVPFRIEGVPLNNCDFLSGFEKATRTFTFASKFGSRNILNESFNYYSLDTPSTTIDTFFAVRQVIKRDAYGAWHYFWDYDINKYFSYHYWPKLDSTVQRIYASNTTTPLVVKSAFTYSPYNYLVRQTEMKNSKGEFRETINYYPSDIDIYGTAYNLIPYLDIPIETIGKLNTSQELSRNKITYGAWPSVPLPASMLSSTLGNTLETDVTFQDYDQKGNLRQYTGKNGIVTAIIWGYDSTYPVAKVVGATYTDCMAQLTQSVLNNPSSDGALLTELNKLRTNLTGKVLVTTYAYKPLIGISKQADVNNVVTSYEYDAFNRLYLIRDKDDNVVKKFEYKYVTE